MFRKSMLKGIASVVIVAYVSVFNASALLAAESQWSLSPQFLAQVANPAATEKVAAEEEKALRQIYAEKIQRLEAEMNKAKGNRNTLLTVAVTSLFIGSGVVVGSTTVRDAVNDIESDTDQEKEDREDALNALDAMKAVGGGIIGAGGVSLLGYFIYTATIGSKQKRIDDLRAELDQRYATTGLTPDYLQRNESVRAVLDEIEAAKKSAGSARTLQNFFSRIGIASLLSGGFLYSLSLGGRDVVEKINVTTDAQEKSRDDALDKTDQLEITGLVLMGVGATSELASFFFGRRAKARERSIDDLENSLLRVAERIDIRPQRNGFVVMYTHEF